jgi:hypothetical protein
MGPLGPIYTMDEAAAALRMCRRTFSDLIRKHPHYHLNGHKKLFDVADLEALWDAMRAEDHPLKGERQETEASPPEEDVYASLSRHLAKKPRAKPQKASESEASLYARARALTERKNRKVKSLPEGGS